MHPATRGPAAKGIGRLVSVVVLLLAWGAPVREVRAQDPTVAKATRLNKQALDAFDNLNFDQAKTLLEQALQTEQGAGLGRDPVAARTHLNMGMLLIAGFQQRDEAVDHFKAALKIQPDIAPPAGLFNPEVQAAFDETKANAKGNPQSGTSARQRVGGSTGHSSPTTGGSAGATAKAESGSGAEEEDVTEEEEEDSSFDGAGPFWLSIAVGSGVGVAKGRLDANRDLDSNGDGAIDNNWSGGLAPSRLGHLSLGVGYFISPDLMVSLEGRLQIISGTTTVKGEPTSSVCVPACAAPTTAVAVFARGNWFLGTGPLRPFVSGGLGVGSIRQVVTLKVTPSGGQPAAVTGCGDNRTATCVDTVTGGPVWLAAGGGLAYQIGSLALLGSLTANVGIPSFMFNLDALFGVGVRL